jgi:hypothetical protein
MVELLDEYTLPELEAAMKAVGSAQVDDILEGIFDCIGGVLVENCLQSSLAGLDTTHRTGTITAIVQGAVELVEASGGINDDIDNYPFLASYKVNGDDDISDAGEFVCTTASPGTCPTDLQLVNLILDLFNTGYTLTAMENAMLNNGDDTIDPIIAEIFDCLEDPLPTTSSVLSSSVSKQGSTSVLSTTSPALKQQESSSSLTTTNTENNQESQTRSLQETSITTTVKAEPEIPSVNTLLENPHLKALLENPDLNALLENPDLNALLEHPDVKALLEDPKVNSLLQNSNSNAELENPTISSLPGSFP